MTLPSDKCGDQEHSWGETTLIVAGPHLGKTVRTCSRCGRSSEVGSARLITESGSAE